jgi:hypothetical protein
VASVFLSCPSIGDDDDDDGAFTGLASGRVIDIENLNDLESFDDLPRLLYPTASVSSNSTDTTDAPPSLLLQQRSVNSNSTNTADTVSVSSCDFDEDRYEDLFRKSLSFVVDSNPLTNCGHASCPSIDSSESFESSLLLTNSGYVCPLIDTSESFESSVPPTKFGHAFPLIDSSESFESSLPLTNSGHVCPLIDSSESLESSFDKSISSTYATLLTPVHESKSHVSQLKNRFRSPSTFSPVAFQNHHHGV